VIVEVKARPEIDPLNTAQVLHYLKATDLEVGLLVNFGRRPEFERVVCERSRTGPRFEPREVAAAASVIPCEIRDAWTTLDLRPLEADPRS
jgi:PD-(D/E)XK nuclease superfamily